MQQSSSEAVGVSREPFHPRLTALFQGRWAENGGSVSRRGEFAVLTSRTGLTFMADQKAVELLAMALGLELARPKPAAPAIDVEPVRLQTRCGWCKALMHEGPLDADGHESTGVCDPCRAQHFPARAATSEIGR